MADPFILTLKNMNLAPWDHFSRTGNLPSKDWGSSPVSPIVQGEGMELAGAISVRTVLGPGETKTIPFVLAWHMPNSYFGHVYEKDYADAFEVAEAAFRDLDSIYEGARSCLLYTSWKTRLEGRRSDETLVRMVQKKACHSLLDDPAGCSSHAFGALHTYALGLLYQRT